MENTTIQSALEALNKPKAVYQFVTGNTIPNGENIPDFTLEDEAATAELLVALADEIGVNNSTFNMAYTAIKEKNEAVTRSGLSEVISYSSDAYKFVCDNWGQIFFLLMYMNNSGHFDKLKNRPKLKTFFKTLFDE
jgi:hypothetical protein